MSKRIILVVLFLLIISAIIYFLSSQKTRQNKSFMQKFIPKKVNYKAGFAIFTNSTFRLFTAPMYHNLSSSVFITADNPNIVNVKKEGVTWDDFFKTLPFKLTTDCLITGTKETFCTGDNGGLKFYLNGSRVDDLLKRAIQKADRALITFGNEDEEQIQTQLQQVPEIK